MKVARGQEKRISVFVTQATDKEQAQRIIDETVIYLTMQNVAVLD